MALVTYTPTVKGDVFDPETLAETVQGMFAGKSAFMESFLARVGAVVVDGSFPGKGSEVISATVTVPYFGTIGDFVNNPDGTSVTPSILKQTSEQGTVTRDSLAFAISRWAASQGMDIDPYTEASRQILVAATRAMDARLITAACASGALSRALFSSSAFSYLNWDAVVDGKMAWGDEQDDIAGMIVQSQTKADMLRLKDTTGRPLLLQAMVDGEVDRFCGIPVAVSDRLPFTGSSMGAVTAAGAAPPTTTLTGEPTGAWKLRIECLVGGARGTATFRFSVDGGATWSASMLTAATVLLTDTAIDSLVGNNGTTGITVAFANASFTNDNVYTATALLKCRTVLLKKRALAYWYNRGALVLDTDKNILDDSRLAAMHLYGVAYRYRRIAGGTKSGVVVIDHNVTQYVG